MNNLAECEFYNDTADENMCKNSGNVNLPIFKYRSEIIKAVQDHQFVIIHGETGCGKTTQVPQYLYGAGFHNDMVIGITQPRRIAAQSMALRVAKEMNVPIGKTVGYSIRFNKKADSSTKIKYMTDGILLNDCILDKQLKEYQIIMIDEAHERSAISDVLLGLLKRIATKRSDLKIIISSATISVDKFVNYFVNAQVITVENRTFEVKIIYERFSIDYIEKAVELCGQIHQQELRQQEAGDSIKGDILVFLTGQDEIFMCCDELQKIRDIVPMPLCSAIDFESQKSAFEPVKPYQTKVVVATNIAETSITIDGIKYVIDCGYVKQNKYNAKRGMEVLEDVRISKSQAEQRKGRAGRTQPGVCHRLYDESVYNSFQTEATPEIYRKNLAGIYLTLRALSLDPKEFDFLDNPKSEELLRSEKELKDLSLMTFDGNLTEMGHKISELPVGPSLGKVLMTSITFKCTAEVIKIVAMFSEKMQNIFRRSRKNSQAADTKKCKFNDPCGDHFMLLNLYNEWLKHGKTRRKWCYNNFISADAMENICNVIKQIYYILKRSGIKVETKQSDSSRDDIKKCFVAGYFRNICIKQPRDVYNRVSDEEVFAIYNSSSLGDVKPKIILFHDAIRSTKSFASGVMQLDESFLRDNFQKELELINFPANINEPITF